MGFGKTSYILTTFVASVVLILNSISLTVLMRKNGKSGKILKYQENKTGDIGSDKGERKGGRGVSNG